ncbi:DMT family transporter [Candidatus Bipolaricaulota sp. J31]
MNRGRGVLWVLVAVFLWSWLGILAKALYAFGAGPLEVISLRVLIAWAALLPFAMWKRWWALLTLDSLPKFFFYSLFSVVLNYLGFYLALRWISVTAAVVVVYAYPALVLVLSRPFLDEPFGRVEGMALVLTMTGLFLVAGGYRLDRLVVNGPGVGLALLTAFSIAIYNVAGKRLVREFDPWALLFWGFTFGVAILWGARSLSGGGLPALPPAGWGLILCLALFPTLGSYGLYLIALKHMRAGHAALLSTLEPLLAAVWAAIVLGECPELPQALGGAMVIGAAALIFRTQLRPRTAKH